MARISKNTVPYFPHYADASTASDTVTVLQTRFGNNGYAFWFKLLEKLASTDGHYIDCRNATKWQVFVAKIGVDEITTVEILDLLVEMQAIDKELWESRIIWCQNLVDNLEDVYKNRRRDKPQKPIVTDKHCFECGKLLVEMRNDAMFCSDSCRIKAHRKQLSVTEKMPPKSITTEKTAVSTVENNPSIANPEITTVEKRQSKVKYSKVKYNNSNKFNKFWRAYPRKKSKGHAEKAFARIKPDNKLFKIILTAIENAKNSLDWKKDDGQFIPYPATWLNAKGWEDEVPVNISTPLYKDVTND